MKFELGEEVEFTIKGKIIRYTISEDGANYTVKPLEVNGDGNHSLWGFSLTEDQINKILYANRNSDIEPKKKE